MQCISNQCLKLLTDGANTTKSVQCPHSTRFASVVTLSRLPISFSLSPKLTSVVTVAGICNSVGGGVFLTCHCSGGAEYLNIVRCQGKGC